MENFEVINQKYVIAMELYTSVYTIEIKKGSGGYNADRIANKAVENFEKRFEFLESTDGE